MKKLEESKDHNLETTISSGGMIVIVLAVWALIAGTSVLVAKYSIKPKKIVTQKTDSKQESKLLLEKINKMYDLPVGEVPTIATVSDKTKLQKQSFFAKAENGDRVIIYTESKKAILYRPSLNKIMEVAPLAISVPTNIPQSATQEPSPTVQTERIVTISIYNGTKVAGLAAIGEEKISEKFSNGEVAEKTNALKDYKETIVIDMTGENKETAKIIAELVDGKVSPFPSGEKKPQGEILVIMGK